MKQEVTKTVTVKFDVPYRQINGREICLDAVLIDDGEPKPMLVYIHGGGWKTGSKDKFSPLLNRLIAADIAWASIDYRLSGEAVYPAQVEDCTYALQFIKSKAEEWNIDPERIALEGHSAGAHLALWLGLHPDQADPGSPDPIKQISTRVSAIIDRAGPTDFSLLDTISHEAHEFVYLFLGHDRDGKEQEGSPPGLLTKAQLDAVSPVSYVRQGNPPVFIIHGTADTIVPVQHSQTLEAALRKHRVECLTHYIEDGNHDAWYEDIENDIFRFLEPILKL